MERPRGHHGDYETMEMMYRNEFEGSTERGRILHKVFVEGRECNSVRERRGYLARQIEQIAREGKRTKNLLSLASGPAAELRDVDLANLPVKVYLLDQDEEAL